MENLERLKILNRWLLAEMPQYSAQAAGFPMEERAQWRLFRSLVNVREPRPAAQIFLQVQDALLQQMLAERGITELQEIAPVREKVRLWQGDITSLRVDAIVNAANSGLTGCYHPCHGCIDNAIHTFAGVQLRLACARLMARQDGPEPVGRARLTGAYNLPSRAVLHTVGPMVHGALTQTHREQLAACYRACLTLAEAHGLKSVAFCCISTGEFRFPGEEAAAIAWREVARYHADGGMCDIVFNVFTEQDREIYRRVLQ